MRLCYEIRPLTMLVDETVRPVSSLHTLSRRSISHLCATARHSTAQPLLLSNTFCLDVRSIVSCFPNNHYSVVASRNNLTLFFLLFRCCLKQRRSNASTTPDPGIFRVHGGFCVLLAVASSTRNHGNEMLNRMSKLRPKRFQAPSCHAS